VTQPRRTNPLSPLVQAAPALPAAALFFIGPGAGAVARSGIPLVVVAVAGAVIGYAAFVIVAWLSWWRRTYWIDDDGDLRMDSGLVQHSARRLQLSRLQSVDVVAPFLARLIGLVEVRVEVAGAGDSRIVLRYLTRVEAEALRAQILELARGGAVVEEEEASLPLAQMSSGRLIAGLLLRSVTAALLLATIVLLVMTVLTQGPAGLILVLVTGGLPILSVVTEFLANYGFRVDRTPDGLRIRRGLLSTQSRTVPPDRVHAVSIVSPLLWRRWGWVRVTVTIAGVKGDEVRPDVLIPVAPRAQALQLIAEVLPGVAVDDLVFDSAPARARWRSPFAWRSLACAITPQVIATRSGRLTLRTSIAPHARVQSVRVTQGPWERRLGLASLHADIAPGPVEVAGRHLAADHVRPLAQDELERMRLARLAG
jgi:putative membrane protein